MIYKPFFLILALPAFVILLWAEILSDSLYLTTLLLAPASPATLLELTSRQPLSRRIVVPTSLSTPANRMAQWKESWVRNSRTFDLMGASTVVQFSPQIPL
jgi:hypothetical protein